MRLYSILWKLNLKIPNERSYDFLGRQKWNFEPKFILTQSMNTKTGLAQFQRTIPRVRKLREEMEKSKNRSSIITNELRITFDISITFFLFISKTRGN